MKVTVLQENLNKAVGIASRFVAIKGQLPILANMLMVTEAGRLKITATNLEMGVSCWVGAKIEKEGEIVVPARTVGEWIASLPKDKVEMEVEQEKLKLTCGGYKAEFRGMGAGEFPAVPEFKGDWLVTLPAAEYEQIMNQVAIAAATDEGRPVLTGVRWAMGAKAVKLAATDGYRLSVKTFKRGQNPKLKIKDDEEEKVLIIPARAVIEVGHIGKEAGEEKGEVRLGLAAEGNQVVFETGEVRVMSRLLAGEFPEFEKIIPKDSKVKMRVNAEELTAAVRAAAILARDNANIVRWQLTPQGLRVLASSTQVGENQVEVEAEVEGEGQIAFNSRYLLDFLGVVGSKDIRFEMTEPLAPGVFKTGEGEDWIGVVMPIRVQAEESESSSRT